MHLGQQLVERLVGYGVGHVFGCPGGQTLALYNGIASGDGTIEHVLMRDERSAIFAADAYARATGVIGVCDATVGPGASNLVSGLTEASACSTPLLAIVSDIPRQWEHRRHLASANQAFEQRRFLEGVVKWYGRVETPEMLPDILQACVRIANSGRPGPVVLNIPADVFIADAAEAAFPATPDWGAYPRWRAGADPAVIEQAARVLAAGTMPVIVAGGGALHAGAGEAIVGLARALSCPVATTMSGKGVIAETHELAVGVAGRMGVSQANDAVAASDCVIFIGCKTGQATTMGWTNPAPDARVIQIDIDPTEIGRNYPGAVGVHADALLGTIALREAIEGREPASQWDLTAVNAAVEEWWSGPIGYKEEAPPGVLQPQDIVRIMSAAAGDDDVVVADASLATGWVVGRWRSRRPGRQFYSPRGMGGLGWGLPGAVGVAEALRAQGRNGRVILLAGDGGWGYSMADVETAVRRGLPIVSVILNNSTLAWIKHHAADRYPDGMVSEDFIDVDFAAAAVALGANGERVDTTDAFDSALRKALDTAGAGPWVIETRSSGVESPVLARSGGY